GRRDIHSRVRRARRAVVDALVAEPAADPALDRPDEILSETGARVVAGPRGGDRSLLAGDALGDRRRRIDGLARHAVHPLDRPVTRGDRDARGFPAAIGPGDLDTDRAIFGAGDAESDRAVRGDLEVMPTVGNAASGRHLADHQRALLHRVGEDDPAIDRSQWRSRSGRLRYGAGAGWMRRDAATGGQQPDTGDAQPCPQRSNSSRWPLGAPTSCVPSQAN